jgi:hypothetical protein
MRLMKSFEVGVPKELISDGAKAELYGRFSEVAKEYRVKQ